MSLTIYSRDHKPPGEVNVINFNDAYFDAETVLTGDKAEADILSKIDKATYCSPTSFFGRTDGTVAILKDNLSTGTKTLLNVISHKSECFDLCECGRNVLELIPSITEGNVYWDIPLVAYSGDAKCDIVYGGKHYTDFYKFLEDAYGDGE